MARTGVQRGCRLPHGLSITPRAGLCPTRAGSGWSHGFGAPGHISGGGTLPQGSLLAP